MCDKEQVITFRQPATANLMLDSADRNPGSTWANFLISRNQSILNGFFTRIGVTEMVLEWNTINVGNSDAIPGDFSVIIDPSGTPLTVTINLIPSFYTVSECMDEIAAELTLGAPGYSFSWVQVNDVWGLECETSPGNVPTDFQVQSSVLANRLTIELQTNTRAEIFTPDLRPYRYLDFTSFQLTYNQDLKDSSTATTVRDVLLRWYFAYDSPSSLDAKGFPILMGYTPFVLRRLYNPPKQIKWDRIQPLGNLEFQVYNDNGVALFGDNASNWLMTLQVSEN